MSKFIEDWIRGKGTKIKQEILDVHIAKFVKIFKLSMKMFIKILPNDSP